jgi:hypothetical protein
LLARNQRKLSSLAQIRAETKSTMIAPFSHFIHFSASRNIKNKLNIYPSNTWMMIEPIMEIN